MEVVILGHGLAFYSTDSFAMSSCWICRLRPGIAAPKFGRKAEPGGDVT
jgi:hypothetical protein